MKKYMHEKNVFSKSSWLGILFGVLVASGFVGFIYETLFYIINNGGLTRRGTCFGPWIQIYGLGGILIFLVTYWIRKRPWLVLIVAGALCGFLEFIAGYCLYHFANGARGWDYNTEIWNWGNIGGYVCFRSVAFFAVAGLLLMYVVVPGLMWLARHMNKKVFFIIMLILAVLFIADIVYNDVLSGPLGLENAQTFYKKTGWYEFVSEYSY